MAVTVTTPTTIIVKDSAARGPVGPAPTFAVGNVTTGAENSSASVTNVGNSANIVLDFSIPRGNTGNVGPTGPANPEAYDRANLAYGQANGAYAHANIVYAQANTARTTANDAYAQANAAYNAANNAGGGFPLANGTSNIDIAIANGDASITSNTFTWMFGSTDGSLDLPGNLTNFTACSAINFVANSSGDGAGYSTIELKPDSNVPVNDQYIIIDPTVANHIHIRAGGSQDNSGAQLYLGGEHSHFSIGSGENPSVFITANNNVWYYYSDGTHLSPILTYALLPSPTTAGLRAFISDANVAAPGNFGAVVGGGGSNNVPVFSDGANWRVG